MISCSISLGFGQDGPYKDRAGYDVIAASIGGLMHITGPKVRLCQNVGRFVQKSGYKNSWKYNRSFITLQY